ncbi:hypothetical protein [Chryseosolibacter indicus]|uniref:Uncharacterized protein n=1 Tax=Chryseosolibacter indicus TaxID=2782351 RepID=A0ABS5VZP2_9BACT|nr:hypothetical protein [Chryseosolibacter indicus]MBT1706189.1 hypothetical protein [Chryseosolibacter indicus]
MANEFKKNVGKSISKKQAKEWIARFAKERQKDTGSVFYGRNCIEEILKDQTISGITFFFARKTNSEGREYDDLILVGTKEDGSLVWNDEPIVKSSSPNLTTMNEGGGSGTYNDGKTCPPHCPTGQTN